MVLALDFLRQRPYWVCWAPDKTPIDPNSGNAAKAGVPTTWSTYQYALLFLHQSHGRYAGIGREIADDEGLVFIDLDKCYYDGEFTPFARRVLSHISSYTEISPSGHGIHVIAYGKLPANLGSNPDPTDGHRIEMYDHGRYFTWTGQHLAGTPETIEDCSESITDLYWSIQGPREARRREQREQPSLSPSPVPSSLSSSYGRAALLSECRILSQTGEGARNTQLNASAYSLGTLVGAQVLSREDVEQSLYDAALSAGLGSAEIVSTLRSGLDAGIAHPRAWEEVRPEVEQQQQQDIPISSNGNGNGHTPHQITDEHLNEFSADDAGNGDALYALSGRDFLWCASIGWLVYDRTHWKYDEDGAAVRRAAVEALRRRRHAAVEAENEPVVRCTKADEGRVNGCVNRFKTLVSISIDEFDKDPDLLNCQNGVVDLRDGQVTFHNHTQRFTYCIPVDYDPSASSSEWQEYLSGVVGGGQEVIDYLQMALGYSLTGHTREEIMFYLYGPTRSGKGTLGETYMSLFPSPLSAGVDFMSFTAKREGDVSNFDLAPLKPCRLIFASESNKSQALNPAKIKQLTGGDPIRACRKHKDFFSYRPQFAVWMMSNHPVNGDPEDDALWGRVRVIEFPHSFLGIEDKTKKERLKQPDAQRGILAWTIQGAMQWYGLGAEGLTTPEAIRLITCHHRAELDYVQQWLDEVCHNDDEAWTANEIIATSYLEWCKNNNVQHPKGPRALTLSLRQKGYEVDQQKKEQGKNKKGVKGLHIFSEG